MVQLRIKKRSGAYLGAIELPATASVEEFKKEFHRRFKFYPERQRFTIGSGSGPALKDGTLRDNGIEETEEGYLLFFKDLGVQISWRLVFVIEYLGPILIFPIFYCLPQLIYGQPAPNKHLIQKVAFCLVLLHYMKRELETLFVHRFSNATMPIIRLPINCLHYWVLFGTSVGYYLFHPKYTAPDWSPQAVYILAALMMVCELLNLKTHLILRNLRPKGTKARGIPKGWGFQLVSCANYFFESLAWVFFAVMTGTLTGWVFLAIAFLQMADWAIKKHQRYQAEFPDYPKIRTAIIPFIL
ncbi:unnamed protein product [Vitrella brassicaformis CCMP3155]|uniref:Ubiquitin-like domain-containing protein n=2 Tax=Vitrella brassicaformis TaxID=1169539 RepID=A0A0G4EAK4_VITBC|nr:unnamed protein product [Vitrella brassicaformis CCMP3155]|mmetsp:Transcript_41993/g.119196  ORF Transcript_41993/g.119196 Transcript_41993/m.119196 type:complete len:299 (+) Transcript_41993:121-1017(+)|eukprot:CEL92293.1 unnamed protein product [Vitrella brassicaformis CCMP3155]